ncbi:MULTISPECIES: hypothetical protein [unclassified Paenibacillus]|uniref:hypothetical protein n=1 Tax=unclassified Paenibacillus TaxID=185978 RepID=UPI0030FC7E7C
MSSFKDQLARDVENVFMNLEEFANEHTIDGRTMPVIVDASDNLSPLDYAEGVSVLRKIIHVESATLGYTPRKGQVINFDGDRFTVALVNDAAGMFVITLEANLD